MSFSLNLTVPLNRHCNRASSLQVPRLLVTLLLVTLCSGTLWQRFRRLAHKAMTGRLDAKRDININFSFPRTKWCGPGNTAQYYDDLGQDTDTDSCCRDHDHCDINIGQGNEVCGVENSGMFAISSCECDVRFRQCLQSVSPPHAPTAAVIARIYGTSVRKCVN
ncbi:unnamed protein product [Oppiella nova]|uniref:Phospholipase A2-like central domain-containing protein n=1 Tax=Oppiella nova TaxID=334625 RepID=A0A7R9M125_9ACAR|nr:unnamed protein product [Oppiella nova]CAG2168856.1 unnamed protein product [Oppiella nova]